MSAVGGHGLTRTRDGSLPSHLLPVPTYSAVARRYGLRPQQVYAWRRLARSGSLALPAEEEIGFVPIIATAGEATPVGGPASSRAGSVEIEFAGAVIRVARGVDWRHLRDVLRAVKAAL